MANTVNRSLANKHFDRIDHALGRPLDPCATSYRNHYAVTEDCPEVAEFRASRYWKESGPCRAFENMIFFHVTPEGRQALAEHLREIGDPHKAFEVTFDGHPATIVAKSHSEARYIAYLRASDCWSELTFADFQKRSSVRRVAQRSIEERSDTASPNGDLSPDTSNFHNEMPERANG